MPEEREVALRIATAWKELRRGAAMVAVRDYFYVAEEDSIEPGQMDTLDLLVQQPAWRMSELAEALRVDPRPPPAPSTAWCGPAWPAGAAAPRTGGS